jgi:GNAT superfamily N-acetyltransferase
MQSFVISSAGIRDCSECAGLLVEQLGEHGVQASTGQLSKVLEGVVANEGRGFVLLARVDKRIVGIAYAATILSAEHGGLVAWLEELYVVPSYRSKRIGSALVEAVVERADEAGVVAVDLEIDAGHSRAQSLYRRLGFRPLNRSRWVKELRKRPQ